MKEQGLIFDLKRTATSLEAALAVGDDSGDLIEKAAMLLHDAACTVEEPKKLLDEGIWHDGDVLSAYFRSADYIRQ